MTNYNVVEDRREWAKIKAGLMTPGDRYVLLEELMRRDAMGASRILGQLVAEQHGIRAKARKRVSYPA